MPFLEVPNHICVDEQLHRERWSLVLNTFFILNTSQRLVVHLIIISLCVCVVLLTVLKHGSVFHVSYFRELFSKGTA